MSVEPGRVDGHPDDAVPLGPDDLDEVNAFYARAYPGTWFEPRMLETRRYVGIRDSSGLACVAGVHVWSPAWRVAALGSVATLPEARGRGLATAACAHLAQRPRRQRGGDHGVREARLRAGRRLRRGSAEPGLSAGGVEAGRMLSPSRVRTARPLRQVRRATAMRPSGDGT